MKDDHSEDCGMENRSKWRHLCIGLKLMGLAGSIKTSILNLRTQISRFEATSG